VIRFTVYALNVFFLTRREQCVVAFLFASLVVGAGIRHLRMVHLLPAETIPASPHR
jgi:hypothetical protein